MLKSACKNKTLKESQTIYSYNIRVSAALEGINGRGAFNRCRKRVPTGWSGIRKAASTKPYQTASWYAEGIFVLWSQGPGWSIQRRQLGDICQGITMQSFISEQQHFVFDSTGSQCRSFRTGVLWSNLRHKDNIPAALFWQSCSWDILFPFAP